jgi:hypothetical protein
MYHNLDTYESEDIKGRKRFIPIPHFLPAVTGSGFMALQRMMTIF